MPRQRDPEQAETTILQHYGDLHGARVLEIGCGDGAVLWRYAATPRTVIGFDLSYDDLLTAKKAHPPTLKTPVALLQADATTLPFASHSFDVAIYTSSL